MDLDTPGEIDSTEGDWLADTLDKQGVGNTTELELLPVGTGCGDTTLTY